LPVSTQFIVDLCKVGDHLPRFVRIVRHPLPDDAKVLRCDYDDTTDTWFILVESESFDLVSDGADIPLLDPTEFQTVFREAS
jgi:hypothetical protein